MGGNNNTVPGLCEKARLIQGGHLGTAVGPEGIQGVVAVNEKV
jgi:hypothetical protein